MSLDVGTLAAYLDLDTSAFDRKLRGTGDKGRRSGRDFGGGFVDETARSMSGRISDVAGRVLATFGSAASTAAKPVAGAVAGAFAVQFGAQAAAGLASGAAKLAQGLGAGIALLPAAALTGVAAMGALRLAVAGVGDALSAGLSGDTEAFAEALEGLSPAAREFARGVAGLKGEVDELRGSVQEQFFAPFADQVASLGSTWLPILRGELSQVSGVFGRSVAAIGQWLVLPDVVENLGGSLTNARNAIADVANAATLLVPAFLPVVAVGSSFLPRLTEGLGGAALRLREFIEESARTGQLRSFIQGGIDAVRSLWETLQQVGRIVGNVRTVLATLGASASAVFAGMGLQSGGLLDAIERLTARAAEFVRTARGSSVLGQVLGMVRGVIENIVETAMRLATVLARAFRPLLPDIAELLQSFGRLKLELIGALEPVLKVAADVASVVIPALTGLFDFIANNRVALGALTAVVVALFGAWAAGAIAAAIATYAPLLPLIAVAAGIGALAAVVAIHFDTIKRWISNVWQWVVDNWPKLLMVLTGPIGIAVALIISHWDTIWSTTRAVFSAIVGTVTGAVGAVLGAITSIPGRLAGWVGSFLNAGRSLGSAILNGIKSGLSAAAGFAADMAQGIVNAVKDAWNTVARTINDFLPNSIGIGPASLNLPDNPIPTFHTGGIAPGPSGRELLAILQGGEEVLTRSDPRHRSNMPGGGAAPPGTPAASRAPAGVTIQHLHLSTTEPARSWLDEAPWRLAG